MRRNRRERHTTVGSMPGCRRWGHNAENCKWERSITWGTCKCVEGTVKQRLDSYCPAVMPAPLPTSLLSSLSVSLKRPSLRFHQCCYPPSLAHSPNRNASHNPSLSHLRSQPLLSLIPSPPFAAPFRVRSGSSGKRRGKVWMPARGCEHWS